MSFIINGQTWAPQSAAEHAASMFAAINLGRTGRGESQLIPSTDNAIWIMCLAAGDMQAENDLVMAGGFASFEIDIADDAQITNLLPIAGTSYTPATYTTLEIEVTALPSGDVTVPVGTHAVFTPDISFIVNEETIIAPGNTATIKTTCSVTGPVTVVPNQITSFIETIANIASITNPDSSIKGSNQETPAQARTRLLTGNTLSWGVDGLIRALLSIQGITQATAFFNPDTDTDLVLPGGTTIPPRFCQIFVIGDDTTDMAIANAYVRCMNAPTQGAESQNYITLAGQNIPIYYDFGDEQEVWVKVFYDDTQPTQAGFETLIENAIIDGVSPLIGQTVSTEMVIEPLINFPYASILGVEVSLDGISYSYSAVIDADSVAVFTSAKIDVVAG